MEKETMRERERGLCVRENVEMSDAKYREPREHSVLFLNIFMRMR